MNHLTLDDVIDFVSLTEINDESIKRIAEVNSHIAVCRECRELVRSFQLVYDELVAADDEDADAAAIAAAPDPAAFDLLDGDTEDIR
ncbi:MAG: hypothetical protein IJN04_01330 [Clostridia bacterium]|nr:hypothetical protein [Clostridia bacterium]